MLFTHEFKWIDEKRNKLAGGAVLVLLVALQLYLGRSFDVKQRDVDVHNDIVKVISVDTQENDAVLANFGLSAVIFQYAKRPVLLHPMFESADIRAKTKECYEALFKSERSSTNCARNIT